MAQAQLIASDILRVTFNVDVTTDDSLSDLLNWSITPVTAGADAAEVKQVLYDPDFSLARSVDLEISRTTRGATYTITVSNLSDANGGAISTLILPFTSDRTKVDSILKSLSSMYETSPNSNIRQILTAIATIDEEIGGDIVARVVP